MEREATVRCDFCGSDIPRADFEVGRAVAILKKHFCPKCRVAAIERSKREDFVPQFLTPRPGMLRPSLDKERPVS